MPYPTNYQYQTYPQFQTQVQPPMDRLAQLQAQQYQMPQQMQPPQASQSWAYVQGEAAAKSWMVGNGQSVLLMDSENPVFYIKSADNSGMPMPLRVFDYKERIQSMPQNTPQAPNPAQIDLDVKYVTRAEYDDLQGKCMEILDRLNNFPAPVMAPEDGKRTAAATNKPRGKGGNSNE